MASSKRYTVKAATDGSNAAMLTVHEDCVLGNEGAVREFWAPLSGGYVRELAEGKPGTLSPQVCEYLDGSGSTLSVLSSDRCGGERFAQIIRREARRALTSGKRLGMC